MMLSVIILTRNRSVELRRALNSCLKNKIEFMEIIVVDNASSDGTKEMIDEQFVESITGIPLVYSYQKTNTGVAAGRNIGFSMAKGKYVFLLDDDAWIKSENTFTRLINMMEKESKIAAISTGVYDVNSEKYQECTCINEKLTKHGLPEIFYFTGGSTMLRKKVFGSKLYLDTLFYGSEEVYASLSIHKLRMKILYDKSVLVIHEPSDNTRFPDSENLFNNIFNLFLVKNIRYPVVGKPVTYLGLILRLRRHLKKEKGLFKKCLKGYRERHEKLPGIGIDLKTLLTIQRKFGLKALL